MNHFDTSEPTDDGRDRRDTSDELLDRLLDDAHWPEPAKGSVERLVARWDSYVTASTSLPTRTAGNWIKWSAAAALFVITGGLVWWGLNDRAPQPLARQQAEVSLPIDQAPVIAEPTVLVEVDKVRAHEVDGPVDSAPSWRPPNAYEQVLVITQQKARGRVIASTSSKPKLLKQSPQSERALKAKVKQDVAARLNQWVTDALLQVQETPDVDVLMILESVAARERPRVEAMLASRAAASSGAEQIAALRLLTPLASSRSLSVLRAAAATEEARAAALPALLRLEDSERLAQMTLAEPRRERRLRILASLWDRHDTATWFLLLRIVHDSPMRDDATAALGNAEQPPIDWLCEVMAQAPNAADRTTAARLLGRLDSPQATARLIELTDYAASRQAALAGLLASSEPSARKFLDSAEQDPNLVASIWNARSQQANP